ncbi:hypothetical protein BH10PLA2_BH10PLA2_37340 [soil metagenome]
MRRSRNNRHVEQIEKNVTGRNTWKTGNECGKTKARTARASLAYNAFCPRQLDGFFLAGYNLLEKRPDFAAFV